MSSPTNPTSHARALGPARPRVGRLVILVVAAAVISLPAAAQSTRTNAQAVLDRVMNNLRGISSRATLTLTVQRPDTTMQYRMDVLSDGDKRSLVRVVAPPRDAGQAFLSVGDNLIVYSPQLGRTLRLPPSGRSSAFLGSDLSYNDLAGSAYQKDYTPTIADTTAGQITLQLDPKPEAPTPYGKLVFVIATPSDAPQTLTFYDQRGHPVKRLTFSDFQPVASRTIPQRFEVTDLLQRGSTTTATFSNAQYGITIPSRCFTETALERGCS